MTLDPSTRAEANLHPLTVADRRLAEEEAYADLAAAAAREVTHACPLPGGGTTPCCDRSPFGLPLTDRMTTDPTLVTCPAKELHR